MRTRKWQLPYQERNNETAWSKMLDTRSHHRPNFTSHPRRLGSEFSFESLTNVGDFSKDSGLPGLAMASPPAFVSERSVLICMGNMEIQGNAQLGPAHCGRLQARQQASSPVCTSKVTLCEEKGVLACRERDLGLDMVICNRQHPHRQPIRTAREHRNAVRCGSLRSPSLANLATRRSTVEI